MRDALSEASLRFHINAGTTALTADNGFWTKAKTTINQGATLAVAKIGTLDSDASRTLAGGTLQTGSDPVMTVANNKTLFGETIDNVTLAPNSLLMVDQSTIGDKAIDGNLTLTAPAAESNDRKARIAVVNATEGSFTLSNNDLGDLAVETDNQVVTTEYDNKIVTVDVDEKSLSTAIGSLGISQTARRTDTVFANTIADRTARTIAGEGVSLWADVGGERYEADKLAKNVQYKSNMFYGAFGAEVGLGANARIGAALQYGTGDSKSNNFNIKNAIDAISVGLYGTYSFNENMKVVGELAYTKTSNDITSSERMSDCLCRCLQGSSNRKRTPLRPLPRVFRTKILPKSFRRQDGTGRAGVCVSGTRFFRPIPAPGRAQRRLVGSVPFVRIRSRT